MNRPTFNVEKWIKKISNEYQEEIGACILKSTVYSINQPFYSANNSVNEVKCKIEVVDSDCIDAATNLENPLVLNYADDKSPGGGWRRSGVIAQEETLALRSPYGLILEALYHHYPLTDTAIYTPNIPFCKNTQYGDLSNPVYISCLAIAAPRNRTNYRPTSAQPKNMQLKIQAMFEIACFLLVCGGR